MAKRTKWTRLEDGEVLENGKVTLCFQTDIEQGRRIQEWATRQQRTVSAAIRILITRGLARSVIR